MQENGKFHVQLCVHFITVVRRGITYYSKAIRNLELPSEIHNMKGGRHLMGISWSSWVTSMNQNRSRFLSCMNVRGQPRAHVVLFIEQILHSFIQ